MTGFRLIDITCLVDLLLKTVCCQLCHGAIELNEINRQGMTSCLEISCQECGQKQSEYMSTKYNRVWDLNRRTVFGMRWIGRGRQLLCYYYEQFCVLEDQPLSASVFLSNRRRETKLYYYDDDKGRHGLQGTVYKSTISK